MSTSNPTPPAKPMDAFEVENFCGTHVCDARASKPHGNVPALVSITADQGALSFHASMLPDTARAMAAALMILADTAEQFELEATLQAELAAEQAAA